MGSSSEKGALERFRRDLGKLRAGREQASVVIFDKRPQGGRLGVGFLEVRDMDP